MLTNHAAVAAHPPADTATHAAADPTANLSEDPAANAGHQMADGSFWLMQAAEVAGLPCGDWRTAPEPIAGGHARAPWVATFDPWPDAGSIRAGREFTDATLRQWGAAERSEDIAVVVSELLTNALQHGLRRLGNARSSRPIHLGLLQPGWCVLCAVADPSRAAPVPRAPDALSAAGRGLHIVCALSDDWGYATLPDTGKVVWAMFKAAVATT